MSDDLDLSPELLEQAMGTPTVRAALRAAGERVLNRAVGEAGKAGALQLAKRLRLTEGTRPGTKASGGIKRPYARIEADMDEAARAADSRARLSRRMILRRAAR